MKAPDNPTVVANNPLHDKYSIYFAPELVQFILIEGKVKTYRYGEKYDYLEVNDKVVLREYETNNFIANAKITDKQKITFAQMPLHLDGHEDFDSKEHQRKVFGSYYKYIGREIRDEDLFLVLSFKLIE